ncbi:MAG: ribonuclease P protein component [Simkania negevensis]|nr:ribonuclease P protein component [Simkania negevensis]
MSSLEPSLKLLKSQKILKSFDYQKVYDANEWYHGGKIIISYLLSPLRTEEKGVQTKLGITISKKWGRANQRNRFKRIVREAYRTFFPNFSCAVFLNVHPRPSYQELGLHEMIEEFKRFNEKICVRTELSTTTRGRDDQRLSPSVSGSRERKNQGSSP